MGATSLRCSVVALGVGGLGVLASTLRLKEEQEQEGLPESAPFER